MRCGNNCTCNRHGDAPEKLFYICCEKLNYPADYKGKCMEPIRQILDELVAESLQDKNLKVEGKDEKGRL